MEIKKFKQHFITFLAAIRSKHGFNIDWHVPHKHIEMHLSFDGLSSCSVLPDHWRPVVTTILLL